MLCRNQSEMPLKKEIGLNALQQRLIQALQRAARLTIKAALFISQ
ncbi:hypothetical protein OMCYN_01751 [cyanobiont of Ornithocercus magnificus]|nr:hypothetical protein OMCYN_01751 [cyanobiont of Ornithocercus magnificus]